MRFDQKDYLDLLKDKVTKELILSKTLSLSLSLSLSRVFIS
jgi:hypothetical protein